MHFKDNIVNFICDRNYYISVYENHLYIFNYEKINSLSSQEIKILFSKFEVNFKGDNLIIKKMLPKELLIEGLIKDIQFNYEK